MNPKSLIGKIVPDFCLNSVNGNFCISDLRGKLVVIYFYPRDNTPGCTIEATDFSLLYDNFSKLNTKVVGISKDSVSSHDKFINSNGLNVTLLSDPDSKVQKSFGVWGTKKFMGREFLGTKRTTFLVDKNGIVVMVWENVKAKGHADEVLSFVKSL